MKRIIILLELGLFLISISLFSQSYLMNNCYSTVSNNAYLVVKGYVNNQSSGNLSLTGINSNVIVQNNITNNGIINSYGIIDLYGDWINNSTYTHNNTSYVYLKGGNQNVGGSTTTTFYNLYLQGTGVKTLGNNEFVDGTLNLQDRELATQNYTMTVNNPVLGAIQRTTGFVSSTSGGGLARATNSSSTYLFPVGINGKYRPADVIPSSTTASIYKVRMANGDATSEGYNRNNKATDICEVNPSFFHIMQQTSGTNNNANINVYYDNTLDGSWDKVGYWTTLWNNYTGSSTSSGSPLYYGSANNVSLSSPTPIALTKNAPVLSVSASPNPICSGQSTVLTASGASTYNWSGGLGTGASKTVTPSATTTYTVTGTSTAGCTGTATVSVTVNPLPTVTATASPAAICNGESSVLTASGANTYSWSGGLGTGASKTVTPSATTTYTVTGTSTAGCTGTATVSVTVNPLPTVTATANPSNICIGGNSVLSASGGNTYNWSNGMNGASITVSPISTSTYTVTGISSAGCTNTTTVIVNVSTTISISANATPSNICQGDNSILSAIGGSVYNWSNGMNGQSINVTPNNTTTYTVTGSSGGCTGTAIVSVTVNPLPAVTASASPATICNGETSVLTANGTDNYSWSTGGTTASITITPSSTTTYTVTGTSTAGCTGTATVSVTVNPLPTVTASASQTSICSGTSITVSASGANTYSWSNGMNGQYINVTPNNTITYIVTGSSAGCTGTASVSVTVNPLPTVTASASPTSICNGATSVLTASGTDNYSWSTGGNTVSITVTPSSTTTYTVTGTSTAGCTGTATVSVTVNPLTTVTASASPAAICNGETSVLTASGTDNYSWSTGGNTASITVTPSSTTTYTVTGTSTTGCNGTATVSITVNPLPAITATANPTSICNGTTSILTASGTDNYSWSTGGNTASITVAPSSTTTYTVTGISTAGCTGTTTVSVTVNPLPAITATANPTSICNGAASVLTASGTDNYSWSTGGNTASITVTPSSTTTYTVTGTSTAGCAGTATVSVTVNPIPNIVINALNNTVCFGDSTTLNVIGDAMQYSWSHNLGSGTTITVFPFNNTTYTVTGTNSYGCTNSATIYITVNPYANATIKPVAPLCDNVSTITLNATDTGGVWSGAGITNVVLGTFSPAIAGAGIHTITYMITGMCGDTATTEITVYESPNVTAYATDETCINGNNGTAWVEITGGTSPYTYLWSTYHTLDSIANLAPGEYSVTVTDYYNCSDKDTVVINAGTEDCYITHIFIPNIFAPDGRGNAENEYLRVYGKGIETIDFSIFDRWGNEVFHSTDINIGWDGTYKGEPALVGDYSYVIKVSYLNGNNESLKGHIYLIR